MNDSKLEYEVSIYLKGDCLDPNTTSNRLGVEPTRSHRKGDKWITSSGAVVTERTGLWVLSMSRAKDVSSALHGASSGLRLNQIKPLDSFGIDDAFIDIFISSDVDDNGGGTIEFSLDCESIATASGLKLPVHFTVALVRK